MTRNAEDLEKARMMCCRLLGEWRPLWTSLGRQDRSPRKERTLLSEAASVLGRNQYRRPALPEGWQTDLSSLEQLRAFVSVRDVVEPATHFESCYDRTMLLLRDLHDFCWDTRDALRRRQKLSGVANLHGLDDHLFEAYTFLFHVGYPPSKPKDMALLGP